ncbi:hypothetical protein Rmf_04250 [Roseomonas fluvialis]|uniref:Uncharacterized protein n=1 Tax=Roseomonas fluvialis TaxID=1750527 RepID=A0ABN6NW63_9PROT|nr:hypothetical protein Rmf_04250 [Roseomonas fluvialis]
MPRGQVAAETPSPGADLAARFQPRLLVRNESRPNVAGDIERLREGKHVLRGLGHAGANMWTRDEGRIANEGNAALHQSLRSHVVDRLKEGLRRQADDFPELRAEFPLGGVAHLGQQPRTDQRRRDGKPCTWPLASVRSSLSRSSSTGRYQTKV